jgi:hypothetical protein
MKVSCVTDCSSSLPLAQVCWANCTLVVLDQSVTQEGRRGEMQVNAESHPTPLPKERGVWQGNYLTSGVSL